MLVSVEKTSTQIGGVQSVVDHHLKSASKLQTQTPYNNKRTLSFSFSFTFSKATTTRCGLTKHGQRFLTSIAITKPNQSSSIERKLEKFVNSSPKSVVLNTLNHLLSPFTHPYLSSLALPLYTKITQASWFSWNSKLVANVIASLYNQGQIKEAEALILETVLTLQSKERDLVGFYCSVIDTLATLESENGFSAVCGRLKEILFSSPSLYVKKRAYESLVGGMCVMGLPHEAENLTNEMRNQGLRPSLFEYRSLLEGYGKLALFEEMLNVVAQMEKNGFVLDTISSNMVISSYGEHNELTQMVFWLQKSKSLGIAFSIRTYNSVLNSCPSLMSLFQDLKRLPLSLKELLLLLKNDEALLVQELFASPILDEIMTWSSSETKLDLHGMHICTSYLILLMWMEELHQRLTSREYELPVEVVLVCGSGKHSTVRGASPVKRMVKELMVRSRSPLKIDRKNIGCFVAKGKAVKDWLC